MPNIQQIARMAGVSTATVSRVLNNYPYVSETTRQKVLMIMEQLDYVPNGNAITLKKEPPILSGSFPSPSVRCLLASLMRLIWRRRNTDLTLRCSLLMETQAKSMWPLRC